MITTPPAIALSCPQKTAQGQVMCPFQQKQANQTEKRICQTTTADYIGVFLIMSSSMSLFLFLIFVVMEPRYISVVRLLVCPKNF